VRPSATAFLEYLLNIDAVTPNITALEYYQRRAKLAKELPPNSVAILAASDLKYASGAVFYKFHQDPDFLYLTGTYVTQLKQTNSH
jgi:intermediate cleaving peptidase 55